MLISGAGTLRDFWCSAFACAAAATFCLCAAADAHAQEKYPVRPIRVIVPSVAGGGTDISARLIAPKMSEYLGQPVVVENREGAASIIGSVLVAHARPDGYTLLMGISTLTSNPSVHHKLPYVPL